MSDSSSSCVSCDVQSGVMLLGLNRPDKKNAISRTMYSDLVAALQDAEDDAEVKVVVFYGKGPAFTSGNDLEDFAKAGLTGAAQGDDTLRVEDNPVLAFLDTYRKFPKPIVVAAHGDAVGIGTTLLLHSDLCYASTDAHFSLPFVKLGLCPEFASSYLLPRLVGHVKAFEWLVQGRPFSAFEAHTFGLINAVVDEPLSHAMTVAQSIAALPPNAVREAKRLIKAGSQKAIDQSIGIEVQQFAKALQGAEFAEAVSAFFEKRSPNFN